MSENDQFEMKTRENLPNVAIYDEGSIHLDASKYGVDQQ
jgi:hypothetical protein